MDQKHDEVITDEEIDAALERAKAFDSFPTIVEAAFFAEPKVHCLMLRLSNGQRMLIPAEMLGELKNATDQQKIDLFIGPQGLSVWWPQLDDGLYLPDFLEHRWGREGKGIVAATPVAA